MNQHRDRSAQPLAHFIDRLRTAEIDLDPFPHYYLEDVFPAGYYQALLRNLPAESIYENLYEVTDLKLDHFRHRDQRDMDDGWTSLLPIEIRDFWVEFDTWFRGPELARAALTTFENPLRERYGDGPLPEISVEAQFIRHRPGYFLGPHSDLYCKLVVLLIYLAPNESAAQLGTSIYRPIDPGFTCPNSKHYPFDDFVRVKTAPYKPNSVLAFLRSDRSFHGLDPLSGPDLATHNRDLIQYVVYDKPERQRQLAARKMAQSNSFAPEGANQ